MVSSALFDWNVFHNTDVMDGRFQIMDEVKEGIKYAFQTQNRVTLAVSATGKYTLISYGGLL